MSSNASRAAVNVARIAAGDDRTRYDNFAIALHWLTVILVLAQFGTSQLWGYAAKPTRHSMIDAHMSFGVLLGAIIVVRIVWRFLPGHRVRASDIGWTEALAKLVHYLLYALLLAQAALGFVLRWSGNQAMSFFGLQLPPPFAPFSKEAHRLVGDLHNWVGWAIIVIAFGHALAALYHRFALHDDVLWRMLPGARARRETERAPSPERAAGLR